MLEIRRYTADAANEWNNFVAQSKNGTFLFDRRYMDYHADRFQDHSLMFYDDHRLLAVMPGHIKDDTYCTHNGLTYGGLVMGWELRAAQTLEIFQMLNDYLRTQNIHRVHYKCVPWVYHRLPAEEDLYAMYHVCHATVVARDFSTNIFLGANMRWERIRRRGVSRAQQAGVTVRRSDDYAAFWKVLDDNLWRCHNVHPVHTLQEIELLHGRFPENIKLYEAVRDGEVLGGVVLYLSPQVVHAQYSSATEEGKKLGVLDLIYEQIMHHDYKDYPYFDFGRSTENADGSGLNEQLVFQKEGFGGRGLCYDIYEWNL